MADKVYICAKCGNPVDIFAPHSIIGSDVALERKHVCCDCTYGNGMLEGYKKCFSNAVDQIIEEDIKLCWTTEKVEAKIHPLEFNAYTTYKLPEFLQFHFVFSIERLIRKVINKPAPKVKGNVTVETSLPEMFVCGEKEAEKHLVDVINKELK